MLTSDRLLPSLDIEKLGLTVDPLELECLRIDPLALHLTAYDRAFEGHDAEIMAVGCLDDHEVAGLHALTGAIAIYSLAGILETDLEIVLVLFLIDSLKPVIYLQLAASLTVVALHLS